MLPNAITAAALCSGLTGIRFAIDDVFREHNLVIAFPQRDVHLDSAGPLEIRLVGGARGR